jgi:uncharacterized YigZ family protein
LQTLAENAEHEDEVKKSRFIARAAPVDSAEAALAFVESVSEPAATHNCWAYRIGQQYRFSDDGEPGGTAGKPILGAIDRAGLDQVVVVVTRYFGGTKLGAGGLARAYGGATGSCLRYADKCELVEMVTLTVEANFDQAGRIHPLIDQRGIEKLSEDFTANGLLFKLRLPADLRETFEQTLADATRGSAKVHTEDELTD